MAPLDPNSTFRLKVEYQNAVASHTWMLRLPSVDEVADAEALVTAVTTDLDTLFAFSEVTSVQFAPAASDIFLDLPSSTLLGTSWGAGAATPEINAQQLRFQGRTSTGRRYFFELFGYKGVLSDFRLLSSESEPVEAAVATLNGAAGTIVGIDGNNITWKTYANVKANDHWVKEARNG